MLRTQVGDILETLSKNQSKSIVFSNNRSSINDVVDETKSAIDAVLRKEATTIFYTLQEAYDSWYAWWCRSPQAPPR